MIKKQIDIITLGCSKNLVDAERLMARLEAAGFRCVHDSDKPKGEIAVISTCGFIGDAKEESINTILEFVERKRKRQLKQLYVMGCLSERYLADLEAEIPEVDAWFGKFNFLDLIDVLTRNNDNNNDNNGNTLSTGAEAAAPRFLTTPSHYAYLKISEGCDRFCSYCAIPLITGRHTSRPIEELVNEARWLVSQGVKELNVIAQDLSSYGKDIYGEKRLAELIEQLAAVEGIRWIRLHYTYPTDFPFDILPVMAKHANVCKYMDIALQHCSDNMLRQMRRHITRAEQDEVLRRIRAEVPGICLRTTLLVGHPGETEADFQELCEWVKEMRFDRMGAFAYSHEDGTYAYEHYQDDIPDEVKQQRVDQLMAIQQQISAELMQERVGQQMTIVIDRLEDGYYIGRSEYDSPEVDCEVLIEATTTHCQVGEYYNVLITRAEEFDLYATIC